jgi:uncharacterized protein
LDFAWKQIINGNSLILSAPRRVGKTSFAQKILVYAKKEDWNIRSPLLRDFWYTRFIK